LLLVVVVIVGGVGKERKGEERRGELKDGRCHGCGH